MKQLSLLIFATALFWALTAYPVRWLLGEEALLFSTTAAIICLIPTAVTLLWVSFAFQGPPEQRVVAVLGGTGIQMLFVIGVGMLLFHLNPAFHYQRFWILIIVFYLYTLAIKVFLVTRQVATTVYEPGNNGPVGRHSPELDESRPEPNRRVGMVDGPHGPRG